MRSPTVTSTKSTSSFSSTTSSTVSSPTSYESSEGSAASSPKKSLPLPATETPTSSSGTPGLRSLKKAFTKHCSFLPKRSISPPPVLSPTKPRSPESDTAVEWNTNSPFHPTTADSSFSMGVSPEVEAFPRRGSLPVTPSYHDMPPVSRSHRASYGGRPKTAQSRLQSPASNLHPHLEDDSTLVTFAGHVTDDDLVFTNPYPFRDQSNPSACMGSDLQLPPKSPSTSTLTLTSASTSASPNLSSPRRPRVESETRLYHPSQIPPLKIPSKSKVFDKIVLNQQPLIPPTGLTSRSTSCLPSSPTHSTFSPTSPVSPFAAYGKVPASEPSPYGVKGEWNQDMRAVMRKLRELK